MESFSRGSKSASNNKVLHIKLLSDEDQAASSSSATEKKEHGCDSDNGQQQPSTGHDQRSGGSSSAASMLSPGEGCNAEGSGDHHSGKVSSVESILRNIGRGSTITASAPWKLTRAVVHLEDAWKGRVSPCPPLEKKEPGMRALFKLRWKYRPLESLFVHLLLSMTLVETPDWCVDSEKCFWSCYPDFTRNYHMSTSLSNTIEGVLLFVLAAIVMVDVHMCGGEYWSGSRKGQYQPMWWKHATIAVYGTVFVLSILISFDAQVVCGFCRIVLYFSVHRRTFVVVTQLKHILGAVAEIWLLIFLNIVLFAWVGVLLFAGTEEGDTVFPDLFEGSWRLFVLFTTSNFPDVMMPALDQVRASIIYFAAFVIMNVFFLAPLSLAVVFNIFRGGRSGIPRMEEEIRLQSTAAAYKLLGDRPTGQVSMANMGAFLLEVHSMRGVASREMARLQDLMHEAEARTPEKIPSLNLQDFKDAVSVMDRRIPHAEWITEVQWHYPRLYQSRGFRRLTRLVKHQRITLWPGVAGSPRFTILLVDAVDMCLLLLSFVALLISKTFSASDESEAMRYDWAQICVVCGFCVTTSLNAIVLGWHNCVQRPAWVFNALITFSSMVVLTLAMMAPGEEWGWKIMRALRVTHMALVVAIVPRLCFLIRTLIVMTRRAATPASVLLTWSFFMAVLGTKIFGGMVCVPELAEGDQSCVGTTVSIDDYTEDGLSLLNFNDVPTSLVTLLVLFVINDWNVIASEFVTVSGTGWARAYFIVNYIIGVAVILNLVVTVVINSFWDEYKLSHHPKDTLRQLHDAAAASARHQILPSPPPPLPGDVCDADGPPCQACGGDPGRNGGSGVGGSASATAVVCGGVSGVGVEREAATELYAGAAASGGSAPSREIGWGWQEVPANEPKEMATTAATASVLPESLSVGSVRRGSREGSGSQYGGSSSQQPPQQARGDEGGMDAERSITRRASRRRLDASGIT